jgi:hypothetical protein
MPVPKAALMRRLRERRRAERLMARSERACVVCATALPAEARAGTKCCSASCRARLSRATLAAIALNEAEIVELHAVLARLLAEVPATERMRMTRGGLRILVTKGIGEFHVTDKGRRPRLSACYRADGTATRYHKAPRVERALHKALCRPADRATASAPHRNA